MDEGIAPLALSWRILRARTMRSVPFCALLAVSTADFAGTWLGEITAPNARATIGLAFTESDGVLAAELYLPEMFVYGVDLGPAAIAGDTFTFEPLEIRVTRAGDELSGTFAIAKLPVRLARGGTFEPEPPPPSEPEGPGPAWSRALGARVWASPIADGGAIYVGATDGRFHAVSAVDGAELWTWSGPRAIYGEACATGTALCFVDASGELVCLDRAHGELRWRFALHDEKLAGPRGAADETFNHRTPTPIVDADVVYVGSTDGGVYAIDVRTGTKLWRHAARARIYAGIALAGDELVAAGYDGTVLRLDRRTRREIAREKLAGPIVSTPVIAGAHVVVGCRDYMLYGLGAAGGIAWRNSYWFSWVESVPRFVGGTLYVGGSDFRRVSAIDPASGKVHWSTDVRGLSWGSPVVTEDTVFAGTSAQRGALIRHEGALVALDRKTGAVRWRRVDPLAADAERAGYIGSLVRAGDRIVGATFSGALAAFPAR